MKTQQLILSSFFVLAIVTLMGCGTNEEVSSNNLYMDIHKNVEGLTAEAVIEAHQKDLDVQDEYGVKYLEYWYDEESGTVFCLVEAPSEEAANTVHREAHGLVADEIVKVSHGI